MTLTTMLRTSAMLLVLMVHESSSFSSSHIAAMPRSPVRQRDQPVRFAVDCSPTLDTTEQRFPTTPKSETPKTPHTPRAQRRHLEAAASPSRMSPASPVTDGEEDTAARQGEHGLSRHFEGTPSSIQKLAAETNMQGLQNENLNKAKVASMLESASVFRTPMPKIPQHMSKAPSHDEDASTDPVAMAREAAIWACTGDSPTKPNIFEVARGQKLQMEEMLRNTSVVSTKKSSRRHSPVTLKLRSQRMSRMGSTPDSSTRKSKRAQRRARAGGAGAGVSTAGAGAGERGGVVMSQAMDGYRAAKEKNEGLLQELRQDRRQMEELLREEEKGVIREEGGVVEEGEAFLNRLDEHCEALRVAVEQAEAGHVHTEAASASSEPALSPAQDAVSRPSALSLSLSPSRAALASPSKQSPLQQHRGEQETLASEHHSSSSSSVTHNMVQESSNSMQGTAAAAAAHQSPVPAYAKQEQQQQGGVVLAQGKGGLAARGLLGKVMRTVMQLALFAVVGMVWTALAGGASHVRRVAGLLRVPRSWQEAHVATFLATFEVQQAWRQSKAKVLTAAKTASLQLSSLLFDLAAQATGGRSADQEPVSPDMPEPPTAGA